MPLTRDSAREFITMLAQACREPHPELVRNATWRQCSATQASLGLRQLSLDLPEGLTFAVTHAMFEAARRLGAGVKSGSF